MTRILHFIAPNRVGVLKTNPGQGILLSPALSCDHLCSKDRLNKLWCIRIFSLRTLQAATDGISYSVRAQKRNLKHRESGRFRHIKFMSVTTGKVAGGGPTGVPWDSI